MDWIQFTKDTGIQVNGVMTKGDQLIFLNVTPDQETQIRTALKTYVQIPVTPDTNMIKLKKIQDILNS